MDIGWNNLKNIKPGDIVHIQGNSFFERFTQEITRSFGEKKTWATHTAIATIDHNRPFVVEALESGVTYHPLSKNSHRDRGIYITSPTLLNDKDRYTITQEALKYIGIDYGFHNLIPHVIDALISKIPGTGQPFLFRRLANMEEYPICSWVVAQAYRDFTSFDVKPKEAQPDDILDYCKNSPLWTPVWADSKETVFSIDKIYNPIRKHGELVHQ